jgi:dihydropteroate synthase
VKESNARVLVIQNLPELEKALGEIGVDSRGTEIMAPKGLNRLVKLEGLDVRAANVVKQEMLSLGAEAAVSKDVYYFNRETTDVILMGTLRHFAELYTKLQRQPFGLKRVAEEVREALANFEDSLQQFRVGKCTLDLKKRTHVMGVLNLTPDSFSDGGRYMDSDKALSHALRMAEEGADLIDVGGESSRPGAAPVSVEEETRRVVPVVEKLVAMINTPVSVDTYKAEVARRALDAGASMVNDISALRMDEAMLSLVVERKVPVVLMHMQGTPRDMQDDPQYESLTGEISLFLRERIQLCLDAGIGSDKILIDPGIGFGKTVDHNLEILKHLAELKSLGYPLLIGASRKSFIGKVLGLPAEERLEGTAATVAYSIVQGAHIVRVHDVREMVRVARMTDAIMRAD